MPPFFFSFLALLPTPNAFEALSTKFWFDRPYKICNSIGSLVKANEEVYRKAVCVKTARWFDGGREGVYILPALLYRDNKDEIAQSKRIVNP